ncbi:S8 family serine peptidase [Phytomonospora endophytica]|uniref:Type VII secretion-associated serine protease mycosin n=1 Tax=Phytomonospora endophytica TaxID=714109 RepID=A0A841FAS4_9ACTN|nr:S8 family serine peptidase [Phytomonospora endophytica]MBB6032864.1 type VII secretion-associated serine protease mycosin [Phytomonospora endophytica]GIG65090.1 hypothetical protein Pen01_13850 [Phytomonospora endophytica]
MSPQLRRLGSLTAALLVASASLVTGVSTPSWAADCKPASRSDELKGRPWPLVRLAPERVYPLTTGRGVVVGLVDSGVGYHPVINDHVRDGKSFVTEPAEAVAGPRCDLATHGTLIAGIIAGIRDPKSLFHGIAPDAEIVPIRVLADKPSDGRAQDTGPIVEGIEYAVERGVDVINLSLTAAPSGALKRAIEKAADADIVIVVAAGNNGDKGQTEYPAGYNSDFPEVIGVAGVDQNGAWSSSSSTGSMVDIAAPGVLIEGPTAAGNGYGVRESGGTSFSAGYVSGTAALLRQYYPTMSAAEVVARMKATAVHPPGGHDQRVGFGEIDPYRAVTAPLTPAEAVSSVPVAAPVLGVDEMAGTRGTALLVGVLGVGAIVILAAARFALPRGRRRGWKG